ncbi:MAG: metallophosphoesterase family protein [Gemmatimonadota bacterium]|nr:metallophosphoesterase family protein [Gemmatimonadota bacterium]MDP7031722.1 metallophosphoesterase family protein [Gemmatimonadota bacterium]
MIAVFSDVHGNAHALEAVLNDARSAGARDFYSLGDVVGYGAHPARCVELVEETASVKVFGNHDAAVLNPAVARQFRAHARTVSFRRVEYDHASAARDILAAGLPHRLADRLESGR